MHEEVIYKPYWQGGEKYKKIVDKDAPTLEINYEDGFYVTADPVWEQITNDPKFAPLEKSDLFNNEAPLNVEIGIGNGEFIAYYAEKNPNENWLGFEVFHEVFEKAIRRIKRKNLKNVRLFQFDAELFVRLLENGAVKGFYVNFPDPWPKARHHKRRLLKTWFIELMSAKLIDGGTLTITTDHDEYAQEIEENLKPVVSLKSTFGSIYTNEMGSYYKTKYYRKFAKHNNLYLFNLEKQR